MHIDFQERAALRVARVYSLAKPNKESNLERNDSE